MVDKLMWKDLKVGDLLKTSNGYGMIINKKTHMSPVFSNRVEIVYDIFILKSKQMISVWDYIDGEIRTSFIEEVISNDQR